MDGKEGQMFFSRITQQWEPIRFYSGLLKKLKMYATAIDRCSRHCREVVWTQLFYLYHQPARQCSDHFMPAIDAWCQNHSIDLFAIEAMYYSFVQSLSQYPNLLDDDSSPSSSSSPSSPSLLFPLPPSLSSSSSPSDSSSSFTSSFNITSPNSSLSNGHSLKQKEIIDDPSATTTTTTPPTALPNNKSKTLSLSNTSLIWGSDFCAAIQQFALLLNWAPLLEKLPPNQKEAIWNTCQFFPLFSNDVFERSSFRKTFLKWAGNPASHVDHIVILFASIGFLRDKGIIKHQFFYPNTTQPVFNNGVRRDHKMQLRTQPLSLSRDSNSPPLSPVSNTTSTNNSLPPFLDHPTHESDAHIRAVSPHSFFSIIKNEPSPTNSASASPISSSMYPSSFLYPSNSSASSRSSPMFSLPYPTTSTTNPSPFLHNSPAPFPDFASLKSPSKASSSPIPPSGTSPSQLGLLALAAIADEQDASENRQAAMNSTHTPTPSANLSFNSFFPNSNTNSNFTTTTTTTNNNNNSSYTSNTGMLSPSQSVKIRKRKSSCGEYEEETKKPRAMNLSHILCS